MPHYCRIEVICPGCGTLKVSKKGGYRKNGTVGPGLETKENAQASAEKSLINVLRGCECTHDGTKWREYPDFVSDDAGHRMRAIIDYIHTNTSEELFLQEGDEFHWKFSFHSRDDDDQFGAQGVIA